MSVVTYSFKTDGNKRLSKDFRVREFRCKDGSDKILISPETVRILQSIRDYFGEPVTINSAYRTPAYNKKIGGVPKSQHVKGKACDIRVRNVPPKAVAAYIEAKFPKTGIGLYSSFVHIDTRGYKARWKDTGKNSVKAFNLGNIYEKYKAGSKHQEDNEMVEDRKIMIFGKQHTVKGILKNGNNYISPKVLKEVGFEVKNKGSEPIISMPKIKLKIDGKDKFVAGFSADGTLYCGVRTLAEALGYKVDWDNKNKIAIIE
ncbi:MAG: DUF882 domain-containing protein [Firmicutes bacterium]|nr:DUF882 domain-containing protein [Bacillota bacterium]